MPAAWTVAPRIRRLALFLAAVLLTVIGAQGPHLVHHLFESDHAENECAFASGAERTQGAAGCLAALIPTPEPSPIGPVPSDSALPARFTAPADARAPPLVVS
jgi:hypothetical protein